MNRTPFYLAALALHLAVLFWLVPPAAQASSTKEEKKYVEVTLSSEPGPARPGPDSGPSDKAKSAVAPGPIVQDSPPPVATITPEPTPPPPTPEPPPDILPPVPPPPPVPAEPTPVVVELTPIVEAPPIPAPPSPPVVQPAPATPVALPATETSSSPPSTQPVKISGAPVSGTGQGNAAQWSPGAGGNGHFYLAVSTPDGVNWTFAQRYALLHNGYLATITSAAENLYVFNLIKNPKFWKNVNSAEYWYSVGPWIGGFKGPSGWQWINGEGHFNYAAWSPGEPDNRNGNQNRICFYAPGEDNIRPTWDDTSANSTSLGFVVEFDRDPSSLPENPTAARNFTGPVDQPLPRPAPAPFRK